MNTISCPECGRVHVFYNSNNRKRIKSDIKIECGECGAIFEVSIHRKKRGIMRWLK
jgi:transcription elongation factor Elf1